MDKDTINVDSKPTRPPKTTAIGSNKVIPSTSHFIEASAPVMVNLTVPRYCRIFIVYFRRILIDNITKTQCQICQFKSQICLVKVLSNSLQNGSKMWLMLSYPLLTKYKCPDVVPPIYSLWHSATQIIPMMKIH